MSSLNIRKGDTVLVISGKDRGVQAKIIDVATQVASAWDA